MYMVMLMPVSAVAMPAGPMLTVFWGAGKERVRGRRERRERVRVCMVVVRVGFWGLGGWSGVFLRGKEGLGERVMVREGKRRWWVGVLWVSVIIAQ